MEETYTFTFTKSECATLWSALTCGKWARLGKPVGKSVRDAQDINALIEVFDEQHYKQWHAYKNAPWLPQDSSKTVSAK
jgi:hypothetical protein